MAACWLLPENTVLRIQLIHYFANDTFFKISAGIIGFWEYLMLHHWEVWGTTTLNLKQSNISVTVTALCKVTTPQQRGQWVPMRSKGMVTWSVNEECKNLNLLSISCCLESWILNTAWNLVHDETSWWSIFLWLVGEVIFLGWGTYNSLLEKQKYIWVVVLIVFLNKVHIILPPQSEISARNSGHD